MTAKTILVVDDSPVIRKLLRIALSAEGYTVLEAGGAWSAMEAIEEHTPDLILQDLILPDMPGTELVRRLHAVCPGVPILAVSGFGAMAAIAGNHHLGFAEVIAKPIEPSRLVAIVRRYLDQDVSRAPASLVGAAARSPAVALFP